MSSTYTDRKLDSSVNTVTIPRDARSGFRIPVEGERLFSFPNHSDRPCCPQPPIRLVPGLFPRGKAAVA
jgi:hypothetical protein